jgi:hypothetical protein
MNYRIRLLPSNGLRDLQSTLRENEAFRIFSAHWRGTKLFRAWAVHEFDFEPIRFNGNSLLGLALAFGLPAGFWAAAGFVIAHLW